jgi:shikimate kinase
MMGSGKTAVGPLLAERLGYAFLDLDREVEQRAGATVAVLFAERGEAAFRRAEAAALAEAAVRPRMVVATGGGVLIDPKNLALAHAAGAVVYLRATPETLASRLSGDTGRPLLLDAEQRPLDRPALTLRLAELLAQREPAYRRADVTVDVEGLTPPGIAEAVVRALAQR